MSLCSIRQRTECVTDALEEKFVMNTFGMLGFLLVTKWAQLPCLVSLTLLQVLRQPKQGIYSSQLAFFDPWIDQSRGF